MSKQETLLRISSPGSAGKNGFEAFRENFGKTIMRIEIDPHDGGPFFMDMFFRALPQFGFSKGRLSAVDTHRTACLIDNDDPVLVVMLDGTGRLRQIGREVEITAGEAILTTGGEPGHFSCTPDTQFMSLRFDRRRLHFLVRNLDAAIAAKIPAANETLQLLRRYTDMLDSDDELATPILRETVTTHMHEIAALLLGVSRNNSFPAEQSRKAARLFAIKRTILQNLGRQDLSVDWVASQNGISLSYMRKLFQAKQRPFRNFCSRNGCSGPIACLPIRHSAIKASAQSRSRSASATCPTSTARFAAAST